MLSLWPYFIISCFHPERPVRRITVTAPSPIWQTLYHWIGRHHLRYLHLTWLSSIQFLFTDSGLPPRTQLHLSLQRETRGTWSSYLHLLIYYPKKWHFCLRVPLLVLRANVSHPFRAFTPAGFFFLSLFQTQLHDGPLEICLNFKLRNETEWNAPSSNLPLTLAAILSPTWSEQSNSCVNTCLYLSSLYTLQSTAIISPIPLPLHRNGLKKILAISSPDLKGTFHPSFHIIFLLLLAISSFPKLWLFWKDLNS